MRKTFYLIVLLILNINTSRAQVDTVSNLPDADKLYGLSKFWSEASNNFAYFDHAKINWDSAYRAYIPKVLASKSTWEYYNLMKRFCALLKDGHTNVYEPASLYKKPRYAYLRFTNFDHHFFVTNVRVPFKDRVPLGSELLTVDGRDISEYAKTEIMPYLQVNENQLWNAAALQMFWGPDSARVWHLVLKTPKGDFMKYDYQFYTHGADWVIPVKKRSEFGFKKIGKSVTWNSIHLNPKAS